MTYFYDIKDAASMNDALREHPEEFSKAEDDWLCFQGKRIPLIVMRLLDDEYLAPFNDDLPAVA